MQRFAIGIGLLCATKSATTAALSAASTATATKAAGLCIAASIHDLLDERFNRAPFGVIGETELFLVAIHHLLLHLSRIEISTAEAATTTAKSTATTTTAATVWLR